MSFISTAYAMGVPAGGGGGEPNMLTSLAPFVLIFVVFYFLLIRPQQKKAKAHREMLSALKKGDYVITAGGFYGRIVESHDDVVVVDLGDTTVTMARGYISGVPSGNQVAAMKDNKKNVKAKPARASSSKGAKAKAVEEVFVEEDAEDDVPETPEAPETPVKEDDSVVK